MNQAKLFAPCHAMQGQSKESVIRFPIEQKLVVAIASSALFDLTAGDKVYVEQGAKVYKQYQQQHVDDILPKGSAFNFIERLLMLNDRYPDERPIEVVLLSRNSAATGKRVFRSIQHYGLDIVRAAFMEGQSAFEYLPAFNVALFLSANRGDVDQAIDAGYPAGFVVSGSDNNRSDNKPLTIAFDFDGVIASDESEAVYKQEALTGFVEHEVEKQHIPHQPGPLSPLFTKLALLQQLENEWIARDPDYQRCLMTAIITARSAPTHERVITTLESWGVEANTTFFLGGMDKGRILSVLKPDIFFDDQSGHLQSDVVETAMVHVPFGIANKE
jgi:5'-nucleotidase